MTNRKPFPILSALRKEGDTFTLGALRVWFTDYHDGTPVVAANDNRAFGAPKDAEFRHREESAERLVAAHDAGEYSKDMHGTVAHREARRASKSGPMPPDYLDAEAEVARHLDAKLMREWLGADSDVLDMAVGPHTYIDVGRHIDAEGSINTIYRAGRKEVKDIAKIFHDGAA